MPLAVATNFGKGKKNFFSKKIFFLEKNFFYFIMQVGDRTSQGVSACACARVIHELVTIHIALIRCCDSCTNVCQVVLVYCACQVVLMNCICRVVLMYQVAAVTTLPCIPCTNL